MLLFWLILLWFCFGFGQQNQIKFNFVLFWLTKIELFDQFCFVSFCFVSYLQMLNENQRVRKLIKLWTSKIKMTSSNHSTLPGFVYYGSSLDEFGEASHLKLHRNWRLLRHHRDKRVNCGTWITLFRWVTRCWSYWKNKSTIKTTCRSCFVTLKDERNEKLMTENWSFNLSKTIRFEDNFGSNFFLLKYHLEKTTLSTGWKVELSRI